MLNARILLAFLVALVLLSAHGRAAAAPTVLSLRFDEPANQWPAGLTRGDPSLVSIEQEGNQRFLRMNVTNRTSALVNTRIPLDPSWSNIIVSAKIRTRNLQRGAESYETASVQTLFFDAGGKQVGGWPPRLDATNATGWVAQSQQYEIPAGATVAQVNIGMWNCMGQADFDDVQIVPAKAGALPAGEGPFWGKEPVVEISKHRAEVVLNGPWQFAPAKDAAEPAADAWGWIRVPGSWSATGESSPLVMRGRGPLWSNFDGKQLNSAWYQRELTMPQSWTGSAVLLSLDRVSTDAVVYVDGRRVGQVTWPAGEVDLTAHIAPGRTHVLRVQVLAADDEKTVMQFMGTVDTQVTQKAATLDTRGLIGDVRLLRRPKTTLISDVFVRPSVRNRRIAVDLSLGGIATAGRVQVTAAMANPATGETEKEFRSAVDVAKAAEQTITVEWPWTNARLWDIGRPELYRLQLSVSGAGIEDSTAVTFGFRELWIDGKSIVLNGTPIRIRPILAPTEWNNVAGVRECIRGALQGMLDAGFNLAQIWPIDETRRGIEHHWPVWYEEADRLGIMIAGAAPSMNRYIVGPNWSFTWPARKSEYEQWVRRVLPGVRNHPSIVMWGTSANFFGTWNDQDPRNIGKSKPFEASDEGRARIRNAGREGIAIVKMIDPTRPVFTHHGTNIGDLHTMNTYLGLLPLQEREQWLSDWAREGEIPYLAIEMGTPLFTNFHRGRNGFGGTVVSEPFYPEFLAMYLGPSAYEQDTPWYREEIVKRFKSGQTYSSWHASQEQMIFAPPYLKLQALFIENTWQSWRTWGITGGMIPWDNGYAWRSAAGGSEIVPLTFAPGRKGRYLPAVRRNQLERYGTGNKGQDLTVAGRALIDSNGPTLAYIAGAPQFTDKAHQFWSGTLVKKQIALLNDTREEAQFTLKWSASVGDKQIASGEDSGRIGIAQTALRPIQFTLPATTAAKSDGILRLEATIAGRKHADSFTFRVYAKSAAPQRQVACLDGVGDTARMLKAAGYTVSEWDGTNRTSVLVVGRKALTGNDAKGIAQRLKAFVQGGGRAVLMAQTPETLANQMGFRIAPYVSRRVFPVSAEHPLTKDLDEADLRDWSAASTLVEPTTTITAATPRGQHNVPYYGWRWGNEGMVTAAPVEKPHHAGWRPILHCEFDLSWSALMELDYGAGRVILAQLELEDNVTSTPAAAILLDRILSYAAETPLPRKAEKALLVGVPAPQRAWIASTGLRMEDAAAITPDAKTLYVVGSNLDPQQEVNLRQHLQSGGRALLLPVQANKGFLGLTLANQPLDITRIDVPAWPETAGLSYPDLRTRVNTNQWLITGGAETAGGGQIGRFTLGSGVAIAYQGDPALFDADTKTYNRLTRWRQTRTLAQLLANLGATFAGDETIFDLRNRKAQVISLAGKWDSTFVNRIDDPTNEAQHEDPGVSQAATKLLQAPDDKSVTWTTMAMPGTWEEAGGGTWAKTNGEAVFRKTVEIPAELAGHDLLLSLGQIDDRDVTAVNGQIVGQSPPGTESQWNVKRVYRVPAAILRPGVNTIAVRIWDRFGGGGMTGSAGDLTISPGPVPGAVGLYHADYLADFEMGDDPFRYFRW